MLIFLHVFNDYSNRLLVGAPKSYDPLQPGVKSPGVLFRCPVDGDVTSCTEVIVDTTGNVMLKAVKMLILAHLSQRLIGELIVYPCSGVLRCCCRPPFSNVKNVGRGNESLYKWSRSLDQDGRHANILLKPLKIFFSRTGSPMILKLGMKHLGLKLCNVYIMMNLG